MRFLGKSNKFSTNIDAGSKKIVNVADSTAATDASNKKVVDAKILYTPVASKPGSLAPGQLWVGW
jgi:hypothetical protein